jgi:hypothetical protein
MLRAGNLKEKYSQYNITYRDVLSAALYPKVFDEYKCARRHLLLTAPSTALAPATALAFL